MIKKHYLESKSTCDMYNIKVNIILIKFKCCSPSQAIVMSLVYDWEKLSNGTLDN